MTAYVEFADPLALLDAVEHLRRLGYEHFEAYTPYAVPGLDERLGRRRSRIPYAVFTAGACGATAAYLIIWYTSAISYPLDVGGRPLDSLPTDIPIVFETMILCAGITAFLLVLLRNGLPRLWDPVAEVEGIERATIDRFWLAIDRTDPAFNPSILDDMERRGAARARVVE